MWPDGFVGVDPMPAGIVGMVAAIVVWWALLEACPQVTRMALQLARVSVLYVLARG